MQPSNIEERFMKGLMIAAFALLCLFSESNSAFAQQSNNCKVCSDQQRACMKNYPGPTCKMEYTMCMKSCKK